MPLWIRRVIAALCGVSAVVAACFFVSRLNARDVVHLYARSSLSSVYEIFEYSGPNWAGQRSMQNNYFMASAFRERLVCALLYHTKPQFGYVIVLFALALLSTKGLRSVRSITAFSC